MGRSTMPILCTRIKTYMADTRAELTELRAETKASFTDARAGNQAEFAAVRREMAELRFDIMQRRTRRQSIFDIFAIVGLVGAVLTIAAGFATEAPHTLR